jgi:uncharacterized glyoxalase superfamily protein PhnB
MPDGSIARAELRIGTSVVMVSSEIPDWGALSARTLGGTPVGLMIYTTDVDALAARFVAAGGKVARHWLISSTAIARGSSSAPKATSGRSANSLRTSRPKR